MIAPGPRPPSAPQRSRLLDAWRAVACLFVVLFHGVQTISPDKAHPLIQPFVDLGKHGSLGRALLFVLSGYCLARSLERRPTGLNASLGFVRERLSRIFLTYWAALALAIVLALIATPFNGLTARSAFPPSLLHWLADLSLTQIWFGLPCRLTVAWSLSYEIGFYLIVAIAALSSVASTTRRFAWFAIVTGIAHWPGATAFLPLLSLWPLFACGLCVFFVLSSRLHPIWRALAVAYPLSLLIFGQGLVVPTVLASALLLVSLRYENRLPPIPEAIAKLGLASYSIFLVHIPFMSPALNLAHRLFPQDSNAFLLAWIAQLILGVVAGLLFYRWVERPVESFRKSRLRPRIEPVHASTPATAFTPAP